MRDRYEYGSTPLGYGRRYSANTYREYEKETYHPDDYMNSMHENYEIYKNQGQYDTRQNSMQNLNDTLEGIINVLAMLKTEARSPQEMDLIRRYIVTINEMY